VDLNPVKTKREENFAIPDAKEIASSINDRTRAILVTNPNNPTGHVLTRSEVEAIVKVAVENDLIIITDEVYREFLYDDNEYISFSEYSEIADKIVYVDSVSKRFSGCGVRIGCLASKNREFMAHALKMCQSRLASPTIDQVGAAAFFNTEEDLVSETKNEYLKRRDVCVDVLGQSPEIDFKTPEGAFYFILQLPLEDADDFTGWLLTDFDVDGETIMVCPAADCYVTEGFGKNEIRISYSCIDSASLRRALNILRLGIVEYNKVTTKARV
jgi:aspartate aminotransferase